MRLAIELSLVLTMLSLMYQVHDAKSLTADGLKLSVTGVERQTRVSLF